MTKTLYKSDVYAVINCGCHVAISTQ